MGQGHVRGSITVLQGPMPIVEDFSTFLTMPIGESTLRLLLRRFQKSNSRIPSMAKLLQDLSTFQ